MPIDFEPPEHDDPDEALNLTSMVDVVFILLAFFVLTARFVGQEQALVSGVSVEAAADPQDLPEVLRVRLRAGAASGGPEAVDAGGGDGAEAAAATTVIQLGGRVLPAGAFDVLSEQLAAVAPADLPVRVSADRGVQVEAVTRALEAALRTHLTDVAFVARAEPAS